jgi:regulator of cell morphogenesis and NO signaling
LKTIVEQHLIREEVLLFPQIANPTQEVEKVAQRVKEEHNESGKLLDRLREVTHNYALPEDASENYRKLYALIQEIEDDMHKHTYLEDDILLKNI